MTRSLSRMQATAFSLLCLAIGLGGCSGGDFGRARPDVRSDDMHRWIGVEATGSVGLPASQFQLTDNERQLRDLAYPLIEPPHSRPAKRTVVGEYKPMPSPWREKVVFDRTAYGKLLLDERCPQRPDALRFIFSGRGSRHQPRSQAACQLEIHFRTVAGGTHRCDGAHGRKRADRAVGAAVLAAAGVLLSLGAGAACHSCARRRGGGGRSPDQAACCASVQRRHRHTAGSGSRAEHARMTFENVTN